MTDDLYPEVPNYPEGDDVLARLTWWRGHGERIKDFDPDDSCEEFDAVPVADLFDAADEIERLRGLIMAWADADLRRLDMTRPNEDLNAAVVALRKAVGR